VAEGEPVSVLGQTCPDPIGVMLDTRMQRFVSPTGIEGLARATGDRLDVLAVYNPSDVRGRLRAFIAAAKIEYQTICVLCIDNPAVNAALLRYGFTPDVEIDQFGDVQNLLRWDKPI
jgi:hypothetical protein